MSTPKFDNSKLLGRIKEIYGTQQKFGNEMGWSHTTTTKKLSNIATLSQSEIHKIVSLLGLNESDISLYFFTQKV